MTIENIKDAILSLFNFSIIEENEERILFKVISDNIAYLEKNQINSIINQLSNFSSDQDVELFNSNSYEVLVTDVSRLILPKEIEQKDLVNNIEYKIDKPTNNYLIFFLSKLAALGIQKKFRISRGGMVSIKLRRMFDNPQLQNSPVQKNMLDLLKEIIPRFESLKIISTNPKRKTEFEQLVYAFIFNLGYNLDYTFQPLRFMEEFTNSYHIGRIPRAKISDIEPPKKIYLNELILHYQKGISTESIDHQFLSFYHVLEHFYEKIYNDDILNSIKGELTKPSFSYKRNKDISNLISVIQSRLKYKNDEFQINEPEALELVLRKFVSDLSYLKNELMSISPTLIEYFKTTEVPFSKGNKINFEVTNANEVYTNLAKRIYVTRNAIVHSKETDKSKYTPFRDDKDLLKEIYLLRLIAEIVIIESSSEL